MNCFPLKLFFSNSYKIFKKYFDKNILKYSLIVQSMSVNIKTFNYSELISPLNSDFMITLAQLCSLYLNPLSDILRTPTLV